MHVRRNFGLDLARALAITMVFLSHGVTALDTLGVGVDLFFVLSGFLIGRIYLRAQADAHEAEGTFTLWGFWSARWLRTLPPYFAALAIYALAELHFHNNPIHWYYLLFLQNYAGMTGFGPSWSLSVEEHFYLALPLLGFVALRFAGRRRLLWLLPLLALVPQALRTAAALGSGLPRDWYWQTHLHCEGLILGVWLAYVFVDRPALWHRLRGPALALAAIPLALLTYQNAVLEQPLAFRATVFLLYAVGYAAWLRLLYEVRWTPKHAAGRWLQHAVHGIALASYSIYLVHTLLFTDVRLLIDDWPRGVAKSTTILACTLLVSTAFYFGIERPSIARRDRLLKP
jgi:peptidoglycan/LPS O-acetylase OafA/YrhL